MSTTISFDDIFRVMAAASLGDATARVAVRDDADVEQTETRFALALNVLLDDLATRATEAREAKFRGLLEAAPDAMLIVDGTGCVILANAQAERLFGYRRDELLGQTIERLMPERYRQAHPGHRAHYAVNPIVRPLGLGVELRALRKDGSEFPVEISLAPMVTPEGRLVTAAIRDITQRKQTETALKLANQELAAFSYSVAHDLRSPLRAMNGFAQLVLETSAHKLAPEEQGWLRRIGENATKMGQLIDALLSLAKVTRTDATRERVDLSALFRAAVQQAETVQPRDGVTVVVADDVHEDCDAQLTRVLADNLVANAWKFTSQRSDARIEFGRSAVAQNTFFVRDNGVGFDMAFAEKLFQPFQRLHSSAEYPGTGIGLATVASVVRRHGGRIWAHGEPGRGATFYFTLCREE